MMLNVHPVSSCTPCAARRQRKQVSPCMQPSHSLKKVATTQAKHMRAPAPPQLCHSILPHVPELQVLLVQPLQLIPRLTVQALQGMQLTQARLAGNQGSYVLARVRRRYSLQALLAGVPCRVQEQVLQWGIGTQAAHPAGMRCKGAGIAHAGCLRTAFTGVAAV
eukprot:1158559-Pelagomonas_calceolata.AAC.7